MSELTSPGQAKNQFSKLEFLTYLESEIKLTQELQQSSGINQWVLYAAAASIGVFFYKEGLKNSFSIDLYSALLTVLALISMLSRSLSYHHHIRPETRFERFQTYLHGKRGGHVFVTVIFAFLSYKCLYLQRLTASKTLYLVLFLMIFYTLAFLASLFLYYTDWVNIIDSSKNRSYKHLDRLFISINFLALTVYIFERLAFLKDQNINQLLSSGAILALTYIGFKMSIQHRYKPLIREMISLRRDLAFDLITIQQAVSSTESLIIGSKFGDLFKREIDVILKYINASNQVIKSALEKVELIKKKIPKTQSPPSPDREVQIEISALLGSLQKELDESIENSTKAVQAMTLLKKKVIMAAGLKWNTYPEIQGWFDNIFSNFGDNLKELKRIASQIRELETSTS